MLTLPGAILAALLSAAPQPAEAKELVTGLPVETVDYVVVRSLDAASTEELLRDLFKRIGVHPRYRIAVFRVPGEKKPHLVYIRGKDQDVRLVKKILTGMEEAAALAQAGGRPFVIGYDLSEIGAREMVKRLVAAAGAIGIPLSTGDFVVYPPGEGGRLFFTGDPDLAPLVAELVKGFDTAPEPSLADRARAYARGLAGEMAASFGALLSTLVSALALLLLHAVIGRLPFIGKRYRKSFRLFWQRLFASFKGKDLAWEIIQAAAGLGVRASGFGVSPPGGAREAAGPGVTGRERKERAMEVASDYMRWRDLDPSRPELRRLLEAAVDAAAAEAEGESHG